MWHELNPRLIVGAIALFVVGLACLDEATGILLSVSPCICLAILDRVIAVLACVGAVFLIVAGVLELIRGLH